MNRRDAVKRGVGLLGAAGIALSEMRQAAANADFGLGHKCQHNHQCASGCCRDGICRKFKKCKHGKGTP